MLTQELSLTADASFLIDALSELESLVQDPECPEKFVELASNLFDVPDLVVRVRTFRTTGETSGHVVRLYPADRLLRLIAACRTRDPLFMS